MRRRAARGDQRKTRYLLSEMRAKSLSPRRLNGTLSEGTAIDTQLARLTVTRPGRLVAAAIHDGHAVRSDLEPLLALTPEARLREEDPHTGSWIGWASGQIVGLRSRFEVDLNRPRDKAVYLSPADAWGLHVWHRPLDEQQVEQSLNLYDGFYEAVHQLLTHRVQQHRRVVVYDLHSYNHHRQGPDAPLDDPQRNPQVNLGTGTMNRHQWSTVVDRFLAELRAVDFPGGKLDVRENVRFQGGHFGRWIHQQFPESVCVLSIEFKKFFMDEWTGLLDPQCSDAIARALQSTVAGVEEELDRL